MSIRDLLHRIWRGGPWTDLIAEAGHRPDRIIHAYYLLRNNGIPVRYRVVGTGGGPGAPLGSMAQTIKIEVLREYEQQAREILDSMQEESG